MASPQKMRRFLTRSSTTKCPEKRFQCARFIEEQQERIKAVHRIESIQKYTNQIFN